MALKYKHRSRGILALALAVTALTAFPAAAQDGSLDKRIERLEKEMRSVQRTVFPGGSPTFFEGEIGPEATTPRERATSTPVTDLTARVDALETQLQALTGQSEQNAFQLRELQKQFGAFKTDIEKRFVTPTSEEPVATEAGLTSQPVSVRVASVKPAEPAKQPAATPSTTAKPSSARLALVKAVEIPSTGNEVQDSYSYGYRLWDAKLYPESQAQLKKVVERWPNHRLASRAQNLLGRAYLDEGKPSLAAVAFYNNYKDRPEGDRAPHSLMYMGVALDTLGRKSDACKAFRELADVYGDRAPEDVKADAAAAKSKAGC